MATWTNIPPASTQIDKPLTTTLATALADNPVAIAQGASGAPKNAIISIEEYNAGDYVEFNVGSITNGGDEVVIYGPAVLVPRGGVIRVKFYKEITDSNNTSTWEILLNGILVFFGNYGTPASSGYESKDITVSSGDILQVTTRATHPASTGKGLIKTAYIIDNPISCAQTYNELFN